MTPRLSIKSNASARGGDFGQIQCVDQRTGTFRAGRGDDAHAQQQHLIRWPAEALVQLDLRHLRHLNLRSLIRAMVDGTSSVTGSIFSI